MEEMVATREEFSRQDFDAGIERYYGKLRDKIAGATLFGRDIDLDDPRQFAVAAVFAAQMEAIKGEFII